MTDNPSNLGKYVTADTAAQATWAMVYASASYTCHGVLSWAGQDRVIPGPALCRSGSFQRVGRLGPASWHCARRGGCHGLR
jgi:hypothetical protein